MRKIAKLWECVRCGLQIPGMSENSTKATENYPFCGRKCLLENRSEFEAQRKAEGLPPGLYTD